MSHPNESKQRKAIITHQVDLTVIAELSTQTLKDVVSSGHAMEFSKTDCILGYKAIFNILCFLTDQHGLNLNILKI